MRDVTGKGCNKNYAPVRDDLPLHDLTGGNTFILNSRSLTDTPNIGVTMGGFTAGRSDMIWSIINKYYRGMSIKSTPFPVIHSGRVVPTV